MPSLHWIGKPSVVDHDRDVPTRPLRVDEALSHGDPDDPNLVVHADNLAALKALLPRHEGRVKCAYIDPPYNTGNEGWIYDDNVSGPEIRAWLGEVVGDDHADLTRHDKWLCMMYPRLKLLRRLLRPDGCIFVSIDDNEVDSLKLVLDEIFGRANFLNRLTLDARAPSAFSTVNPGVFKASEYVLWYARDKSLWRDAPPLRVPRGRDPAYNKFVLGRERDPAAWRVVPLREAFLRAWNADRAPRIETFARDAHEEMARLRKAEAAKLLERAFPFSQLLRLDAAATRLTAQARALPEDAFVAWATAYLVERCTRPFTEEDLRRFVVEHAAAVCREAEISDEGAGARTVEAKKASAKDPDRILVVERGGGLEPQYVRGGRQLAFYAKNVHAVDGEPTPTQLLTNVWTDVSWEGIAQEGGVVLKKGKKPERLVRRLLQLATKPGDLVLDCFAGSGTTGAVAHKMGRKWILVEREAHCRTHVLPRLRRVVDGKDPTGVTALEGWRGGGGFRFCTLGTPPS